MILGHTPQDVRAAAMAQLEKGILYGGQSGLEAEAARLVCQMVPCAQKLRFGSSGSEAVQIALRIARAATGRRVVVKFAGHYHGWFDNILWSTQPPPDATAPVAGSKGQQQTTEDVAVLEWNLLPELRARLDKGDVAAVIMEPAMCNAGAIFPLPGYLEGAREACTRTGTILIFDEVITGFRVGPGGAQQRLGVTPDLATFAKAIANGFPVAAVAGRADLMDLVTQGVVHGGTYNGQSVAIAATVATLKRLRDPQTFEKLEGARRTPDAGNPGGVRPRQGAGSGRGLPGDLPSRHGRHRETPQLARPARHGPQALRRLLREPAAPRRARAGTRRLVPLHRARRRNCRHYAGSSGARSAGSVNRYSGTIATARVHPADARCTFTGKHTISNPSAGNASRLWSFSKCE
jgi:hypothetical protein